MLYEVRHSQAVESADMFDFQRTLVFQLATRLLPSGARRGTFAPWREMRKED
jgi:hypothetical protein